MDAIAPTGCQQVMADLTSGGEAGGVASFFLVDSDFSRPDLDPGDQVVLVRNASAPPDLQYSFADFQRTMPLVALLVLFALACWCWPASAVCGPCSASASALPRSWSSSFPPCCGTAPPLAVALTGTIVIAVVALYLTHGVSWPTTVALLGTLLSVVVVGLLGVVFVQLASFTALSEDAAQVLRVSADAVDLRGLLVAGIVISALGVLDDVTVTQVSAVEELRRADPTLAPRALYRAALRIGRDHVAATVNTLVLAYVGASLPLMLLFVEGNQPLSRVATSEVVAIEIVRMLVGSIGLVLAVPVTTALAAVVLTPVANAVEGRAEAAWEDFGPVEGDGS